MSQFIETKSACGFQKLVSENGDGLQMGVSLREKMRVFCNSDVGWHIVCSSLSPSLWPHS